MMIFFFFVYNLTGRPYHHPFGYLFNAFSDHFLGFFDSGVQRGARIARWSGRGGRGSLCGRLRIYNYLGVEILKERQMQDRGI